MILRVLVDEKRMINTLQNPVVFLIHMTSIVNLSVCVVCRVFQYLYITFRVEMLFLVIRISNAFALLLWYLCSKNLLKVYVNA